MRSNRRPGSRRGRNDGSFWLSFSDLMSSLVLIVILVIFYIIYQYFNLAEINAAEIARREYQLSEAQTELESQQTKLTDAEKQMIAQQILLDAKEKELESAQAILESQKAELASTQSQLTDKEIEIANQQAQLIAMSGQLNQQKAQLDTQQVQLNEQQAQLSTQKQQLSAQQAQIDTQLVQLDNQQAQIDTQLAQLSTQKSQIDTQQAQLDSQQAQIEELVGMKTRIITSLSAALKQSNISATVDPVNGSIALESDVLFESGKYKLSENGKSFVDDFLPVYLEVLFSDEYKPYVAEIIVEGHTDSDGGYLSNLELSQQRALAVASYVLGDGCDAVSNDMKNKLRPVVTVNGRSYSERIFNPDGTENKDACRRVVFKFRLTDEQMIRQLQQILESAEETGSSYTQTEGD